MSDQDFEEFRLRMREKLIARFGEGNVAAFWGNPEAKIVSISQAPSASTVKNQRPFADKSGEKLRKVWYQVNEETFYNQDNFYFTAIGMYYPGKGKNGDLKPSLAIAERWLKKELSFLNPQLFLIVGTLAVRFFFPRKNLADLVFNDQELNGKLALVLPHPSPLNIKWFKDHPEFKNIRLKEIQSHIHEVLGLK